MGAVLACASLSRPRRLALALLLGVTLVQIHGLLLATTAVDPYVQKLHEHGEGHGEVDVALGDVLVEALQHQHEPHQEQEAQCQHLQRGVAVDAGADRSGRGHHAASRGPCWPHPPSTSTNPTRSRKLSASIFSVGWRLTKLLIAPAETIMMPTAITTAAIITASPSTTPTAGRTGPRGDKQAR